VRVDFDKSRRAVAGRDLIVMKKPQMNQAGQ
jgi:hypothetical protein